MKIVSVSAERKIKSKKKDGITVELKPSKKIKYYMNCSCDDETFRIQISERAYNKLTEFNLSG